jgi:hypothetical protein
MANDLFSLPSRFSTAVEQFGQAKRTYPIPLDTTHYTIERNYCVKKSSYTPLALNTADTEYSTAYIVANDVTREEGDAVWFKRTYATIPANRTEQIGSYAYTFPGLTAGSTTTQTPSSFTGSVPNGPFVITLTSHGYSVGNKVRIVTLSTVTVGASTIPFYSSVVTTITAVTTNTFTVTFRFLAQTGGTNSMYSVALFVRGTGQLTLPSSAYETSEYFLPGVSSGISSASDIVPNAAFYPFASTTGNVVTTLSTGTVPTVVNYLSLISNNQFIVAQSSVAQYLGNILCRKTLYVMAQ